jgi:hypothetical protein
VAEKGLREYHITLSSLLTAKMMRSPCAHKQGACAAAPIASWKRVKPRKRAEGKLHVANLQRYVQRYVQACSWRAGAVAHRLAAHTEVAVPVIPVQQRR